MGVIFLIPWPRTGLAAVHERDAADSRVTIILARFGSPRFGFLRRALAEYSTPSDEAREKACIAWGSAFACLKEASMCKGQSKVGGHGFDSSVRFSASDNRGPLNVSESEDRLGWTSIECGLGNRRAHARKNRTRPKFVPAAARERICRELVNGPHDKLLQHIPRKRYDIGLGPFHDP